MMDADGRFAVHIEGIAAPVLCRSDEPILDAALAQGIALPHNCRGGACGTCRATLLSGATSEGWIQSFALTDEDRAQGKVLPCVARPLTDCRLRLDSAMMPPTIESCRIGATVIACEAVAQSVRRLVLEPDAVRAWRAGAQVRLVLPGVFPDRVYSIASAFDGDHLRDNQLELFITIRPEGRAGRIVDGFVPGVRVDLDGPHGTLAIPDGAARIVLAAGGTGLSPLLSLARQALARGDDRPMLLLFSVPGPRDLFALDALKALCAAHPSFSYRLCLTRVTESGLDDVHYGRVTGILGGLVEPDAAVLAAGSAGFGADVRAVARDHGVDPALILIDSFLPAQ